MNKGSLLHCHYSGIVKGERIINYLFIKKKIIFKDGLLNHDYKKNNYINKDTILKYFRSINQDFKKIGDFFYFIIKDIHFFKNYHYLIIQQMKNQNITNIQIRISLGTHFKKRLIKVTSKYNKKVDYIDRNGNKYHSKRTLIPIKEELDRFLEVKNNLYKKNGKDMSIIVQLSKYSSKTYSYFDTILDLLKKYPEYQNLIKGFDLVGYEHDNPISDKKDVIKKLKKKMDPLGIQFFFHAGEGCFNNICKDNLKFALKYGGNRIAHGIELLNYPKLLKKAIEKKVVLEICPLSNIKVVKYESDIFRRLRMSKLLFTISSDDPNKLGDANLNDNFIYLFKEAGFTIEDLKKTVELSNKIFYQLDY